MAGFLHFGAARCSILAAFGGHIEAVKMTHQI